MLALYEVAAREIFVVSVSFFLIAEVDSPRSGVIRVQPHNLQSVVESLKEAKT